MATDINDITSAEWSLSVKEAGGVVENYADIDQCIGLIVSTAKGSDPLRPAFGCDIWRHLDTGSNVAVPNMVREILDALATWERRIEVTNIAYTTGEEKVSFDIKWVLQGNKQRGSTQLALSFVRERDMPAPAPVITPIDTPANFTAYYIDLQGVLAWDYPSPTGVTFQILRSVEGGAFEQIASVVGVTGYTDAGVEFDTLYTYRVRAIKGTRASGFSEEAGFITLAPIIEFAAVASQYISITKTGTAAIVQSAAGVTKVYAVDSDPQNITAFLADDAGDADLNAGITGLLELTGLSGLRTIRARNQSFEFLPDTWVRNASVNINIANSITTASRVASLIDAIIVANGGTTTDNGSNYTGTPGENHASRVLDIGSIELDLADPANTILFEKVVALGTVGWTVSTVSTVCLKSFDVSTGTETWAAAEVEKTRQLAGVTLVDGQPMELSLYDTLANAEIGTATGRLANGYALTDAWLRNNTNYNAWTAGTLKALRFYAADGISTNNRSLFAYKAAPTGERACGNVTVIENQANFLLGNAKTYNGTSQYDRVLLWSQMEWTQAWSANIHLETAVLGTFKQLFVQGANFPAGRRIEAFITNSNRITLNFIGTGGALQVATLNPCIVLGRQSIILTWNGTGVSSGFNFYVDGVLQAKTSSGSVSGTLINGTINYLTIGAAAPTPTSYMNGKIRQLEIINRVATAGEIALTESTGSFQGAGVANADYLLAPDFDKTDGNPLTTRAGTPTYTITAFGGATYTPYL